MTRIAKKSRVVKRQGKRKPAKKQKAIRNERSSEARFTHPKRPRYTIRKDSLDRRYAIDKRTGQRVSLYKAEKERAQRRKAAKPTPTIPRNKTPKVAKPSKKRSEAAKRGWAKRKAASQWRPPEPVELVPISVLTPPEFLPPPIPPGVRMVPLYENIRDRMARYPKVKEAAEDAFTRLQIEAWNKHGDKLAGKPIPHKMTREERIQGNIRDIIAERIVDPGDIDRVLEEMYVEFDEEFTMRELYSLYFSPDVA